MWVLENALSFGHRLLTGVVKKGDLTIDATIGNGHDTLFLANLVGETGKVYGFDIQEKAVNNTRKRLIDQQVYGRVELYQHGHETIGQYIPQEERCRLKAAVFNLGYLPGGTKHVVTKAETTIRAIDAILELLQKGGIVVLLVYHGHPEGKAERDKLLQYVDTLDQRHVGVLKYEFINQRNHPPFLLALEKK